MEKKSYRPLISFNMEFYYDEHLDEYLDVQNLINSNYGDDYEIDESINGNGDREPLSPSVYFVILDAFWLIIFIGGFVTTELKCNGLTRIVFRGKSIVLIVSLVIDISQRLYFHFTQNNGEMNFYTVLKVKYLLNSQNEGLGWGYPSAEFLYNTAKECVLLMDQGMTLIFVVCVYDCTSKMQAVEDPLKGVVRNINVMVVVITIGSALQFLATYFLPQDLVWIHIINGVILPLGKVFTTVSTMAVTFYGIKTLLALANSRSFQKTCGSKASSGNTFLISIIATMLFTQFIKCAIQVAKVTYQFSGDDAFQTCVKFKSVEEEDKCLIEHTTVSRKLSVTISSPWYNLAEYVSVLFPLVYAKLKRY